jgi:outer membrane protein assembly factor BamA
MQVMEDRQKSLTSNIALKNSQAAVEDAKELDQMFNDVETFYAHKGNASDAVTWTKESKNLAVAITQYVASNDFDTASVKAVSLAKTCKECHSVYKKDS